MKWLNIFILTIFIAGFFLIMSIKNWNWTSNDYYSNRDFEFILPNVVTLIECILELLISLSLFKIFFHKKSSDLKTPYFYFLSVGYFQGFVINVFWEIETMAYYDGNSILKYPVFFFQWYWSPFASYWTAILAFNRCIAIGFPLYHKKVSCEVEKQNSVVV